LNTSSIRSIVKDRLSRHFTSAVERHPFEGRHVAVLTSLAQIASIVW
jgi:hypothetical protein